MTVPTNVLRFVAVFRCFSLVVVLTILLVLCCNTNNSIQQYGFVSCQRIYSTNQVRSFSKHPSTATNDSINVVVKFHEKDAFRQRDLVVESSIEDEVQQQEELRQQQQQPQKQYTKSPIPPGIQRLLNKYSPSGSMHVTAQLERTNAISMKINVSQLDELLNDSDVEYIEYDHYMYPLQYHNEIQNNELFEIIQASGSSDSGRSSSGGGGGGSTSSSTSIIPNAVPSNTCFHVCIIDSGLFFHDDIPFQKNSPRVHGREFNMPVGQRWDNPNYNHGTHVAGIMLAQSGNGIGIQGVLENAPVTNNVCLLVARVFDDSGNGQQDSVIASAAEWCADNGAKVINFSLGSEGFRSDTLNTVFKNIRYKDNVLLFAASGNSGTSTYNYPASYDGVISVGAIGDDQMVAYYSVANDAVDIVAPGSNILSTVPVMYVYDDSKKNIPYEMILFEYSIPIDPTKIGSRTFVGCGLAKSRCRNASGKVCIIQRGVTTFTEKAMNCQNGGGIAAIIYNDNEKLLPGTLTAPGYIKIPVVGVSKSTGQALKRIKSTISFSSLQSGYTTSSGTSMSTPFVSGIAVKLWSVRPQCTANQIEESILKTAHDLGQQGKDIFYGNGLIQAEAAYRYLQKLPAPCGGFDIKGTATTSSARNGDKVNTSSNTKTVYTTNGNAIKITISNNGNRRRHQRFLYNNNNSNSNNLRGGNSTLEEEEEDDMIVQQQQQQQQEVERGPLFPTTTTSINTATCTYLVK